MDGSILLVVGWIVLLAIIVTAAVASRTPRGSGGAPGEVVADRPLTGGTGSSWDVDRSHAGPAEDRPGGPDAEAMDPEGTADERTDGPR